MFQGRVKWYNSKHGYGFITPLLGDKDVFFHVTQIQQAGINQINEGQLIGYETYDDRGRTAAGNLKLFD